MLAFIMFLPFLVCVIFYCLMLKGKNPKKCFIAKSVCSLFFVIIGLIFFVRSKKSLTDCLVLCGLILGALGDIILDIGNFRKESYNKYFLCGGGSFLLGHFAYIVSLCILVAGRSGQTLCGIIPISAKNSITVPVIVSVIVLPLLVLCSHKYALPVMNSSKNFKAAVGLYLIIVSAAAALATSFGLFLSFRSFITYSAGFILFLISDSTLMTNLFGTGQTFRKDCIIIPSYYLAQFIFALTIFLG